jgi:hypothetical protein
MATVTILTLGRNGQNGHSLREMSTMSVSPSDLGRTFNGQMSAMSVLSAQDIGRQAERERLRHVHAFEIFLGHAVSRTACRPPRRLAQATPPHHLAVFSG